jgi:hypothetical protein
LTHFSSIESPRLVAITARVANKAGVRLGST